VMNSPPRKPPVLEGSGSRTSGRDSLPAGETPSKSSSSSKAPPVGSSSKVCVFGTYNLYECVHIIYKVMPHIYCIVHTVQISCICYAITQLIVHTIQYSYVKNLYQ